MLRRLTSLKVGVALAMLAPALIGLFVVYAIFSRLEGDADRARTIAQKTAAAQAVARLAERGASTGTLQAAQGLLGDDQLIVTRGGQRVFTGPSNPERPALPVTVTFPGGQVTLISDIDPTPLLSWKLTAVAGLLAALLIASAAIGTGLLSRRVREPISRAILAADRVASGDLTARMGQAGPEEFQRMARAFDGMAERLEATDLAQRRFLADLAHEIVTPFNAIAGTATGALEGTFRSPGARAEAADLIAMELDRLRELLNEIRELGLLDIAARGQQELVDLTAVCQRVAARFRPLAAQGNLGLELRLRVRRAESWSKQRLVETVLDNLVANAVRYTPPGGHVTITLWRRESTHVISVADTGIGIAPEHRDLVFEPLYRADTARDRGHGGSGLGLAIARRATQALGGTLELDSSHRAGTEFRLILPD